MDNINVAGSFCTFPDVVENENRGFFPINIQEIDEETLDLVNGRKPS